MTATLEPTYDEVGAPITPGTLCWVQTRQNAPRKVRDSRCLAVYAAGTATSTQRWCLLIPMDPGEATPQQGWRLRHNMTDEVIRGLNLERFVDTHRGWWPGEEVEFIETAIGYWCVEHQVFHAAETCPPYDWAARVAQLEKDLADARAANETLVKDHEAFKVRASDVLAMAADEHDLCGQYDQYAEEAGLYRRTADYPVVIEVTYRQEVVVNARSQSYAEDLVRDGTVDTSFHPDCPLTIDLQDIFRPIDVAIKVVVEPPF